MLVSRSAALRVVRYGCCYVSWHETDQGTTGGVACSRPAPRITWQQQHCLIEYEEYLRYSSSETDGGRRPIDHHHHGQIRWW
nr:hypothetical protein CFP56_22044 [Quercus suber]